MARTIDRKIAGAFIFSSDGKVLLGHNKKGGVYQGMLVVPGGGIEPDETELEALRREVLEETGIDISGATVSPLPNIEYGESKKTLKNTNEVVLVKMTFHDFVVKLPVEAKAVSLAFDDDFGDGKWYTPTELQHEQIGPNSLLTLRKLGFLE